MDHHVRSRQVKPCAAGFQGDEKHISVVLSEPVGHVYPLLLGSLPGQHVKGHALSCHPLPDELQHGGKLGEDNHAVPPVQKIRQLFHEKLHLPAIPGIILHESPRMATNLSKPGERSKNLHPPRTALDALLLLHLHLDAG